MKKEIGEKAGLVYVGKNEEGENEFIGTKEQWAKADELETLDEFEDYLKEREQGLLDSEIVRDNE